MTQASPLVLGLLDALTKPSILLDPEYRILAANRAYRRAFGGGDEVAGRHCYEVSHHYTRPCDQAGESCPLKTSLTTGEPSRVLHLHHTPRGLEHVDVELTPVRDGAGQVIGFLESMRTLEHADARTGEPTLVGHSPAFNRMLGLIARAAPAEVAVLLLGESGTGKELGARAVHAQSARRDGPLVPVDCSGLPETLFESELFGYERGAFTGATARKAGLVEAAAGGTLFLDEIGDVPLPLQVKLLRLLETASFRRVGGLEPLRADFRLVCATHRDLEAMVAEGSFRADLYYRIAAFPIRLPPLRERGREDIERLSRHLLQRVAPTRSLHLHPATLDCLGAHAFPGNVRELKNLLERASLMADGDSILPAHLPEPLAAAANPAPVATGTTVSAAAGQAGPQVVSLREAQARYLAWAATVFGGDRKALAARLGLSERSLYRLMRASAAAPARKAGTKTPSENR